MINAIGCRSLYGTGVEFFRALAYATEGSYQHIGRLTSARPGELTEALGRSAMPAGDGGGRAGRGGGGGRAEGSLGEAARFLGRPCDQRGKLR